MFAHITKRLLMLFPIVLGVSTIVFISMHLVPGDPVKYLMRGYGTLEQMEKLRHKFGLDKPIHIQYLEWLKGLATGDWGTSILYRQPVIKVIGPRFQATLELALTGTFFAILIGLPLGTLAAIKKGTLIDTFTITLSLIGVSIPIFVYGVLFQIAFSLYIPLFPALGRVSPFENILQSLHHLVLPALSAGLFTAAFIARNIRSEMIEVLNADFIKTARAKGLLERSVYIKHALRNSLLATLTIIGLMFGMTLAGSVVTELVFQWPGIGTLFVKAALAHDYRTVQAVVLIYSLSFVMINLIVDLLYALLDPRIRY